MQIRMPLALVVVASGLCSIAPAEADTEQAPRTILAAGDYVRGVGRLAVSGLDNYRLKLQAIDKNGRALVAGDLSDGRSALVWVNGSNTVPAWSWGEPISRPIALRLETTRSSPSGKVAVLGHAVGSEDLNAEGIYLLRHEKWERLVGEGDSAPDGRQLHAISIGGPNAVTDDGLVGFTACDAAPPDPYTSCEDLGAYTVDGQGHIRVLAHTADPPVDGWKFGRQSVLAVLDDGSVILAADRSRADDPQVSERGIFRFDDTGVTALVVGGDIGPSGFALEGVSALAASRSGDVLFRASENGAQAIYRTFEGAILRTDVPLEDPEDTRIQVNVRSFNDAGDIAVELGNDVRVYYAAGNVETISHAHNPRVNDAGELAYESLEPTEPFAVVRRRQGVDEVLVADGDPAPDQAFFGRGSFGCSDLSSTGHILGATLSSDRKQALLCGSDAGFAVVAQTGTPVGENARLESVGHTCRLIGVDEVVFSGTETVTVDGTSSLRNAIFRANGSGVKAILEADPDPSYALQDFAVNAHGTVVVYQYGPLGGAFLVAKRGKTAEERPLGRFYPEPLDLDLTDAKGARLFGLADDGTIVAIIDFGNWTSALVTFSDGPLFGRIDTLAKAQLIGYAALGTWAKYTDLLDLYVAGNHVLFEAETFADCPFPTCRNSFHPFHFTIGDSSPVELSLPYVFLHGITPAGRILFLGSQYHAETDSWIDRDFIFDGERLSPIPLTDSLKTEAVAINDRGNTLLKSYWSGDGTSQVALSLIGPSPAEEECLQRPLTKIDQGTAGSSSGSGCAIASSSRPAISLLVALLAVGVRFVSARRRSSR